MLNTVGIRTMAMIANMDNKPAQAKITAALMSGEQVTRNRVALMINPAPVPKAKPTYEVKLQAVKAKLSKWTNAKMKENMRICFKRTLTYLKRLKLLKKRLTLRPDCVASYTKGFQRL